jgi:hypothetical protein
MFTSSYAVLLVWNSNLRWFMADSSHEKACSAVEVSTPLLDAPEERTLRGDGRTNTFRGKLTSIIGSRHHGATVRFEPWSL